jgi:hypothetical protein
MDGVYLLITDLLKNKSISAIDIIDQEFLLDIKVG